jgi:hypothetical protein
MLTRWEDKGKTDPTQGFRQFAAARREKQGLPSA